MSRELRTWSTSMLHPVLLFQRPSNGSKYLLDNRCQKEVANLSSNSPRLHLQRQCFCELNFDGGALETLDHESWGLIQIGDRSHRAERASRQSTQQSLSLSESLKLGLLTPKISQWRERGEAREGMWDLVCVKKQLGTCHFLVIIY